MTQPHDRGRGGPPGGGGEPPRSPRGWPGRRHLAVLMTGTALLGGGATAALLAATGNLDNGGTTTTVIQRPTTVPTAATATASSGSEGTDWTALYAAASPGVVNITSEGVSTGGSSQDPFGQGQPQSGTATGSGFVADANGTIVTAAHVVDGASKITIRFSDGTTKVATLQGKDDATDIAVLKVDPSGMSLHPLQMGSSAGLKVGDELAAIGSPFGYASSLSTGIVSGLDRTIEAPNGFTVAHAIQTDAALNPGNSGGPILGADGRVVGVADQIATGGTEQSAGVGFAVPIDLVADEVGQLAAGQKVAHAYLGVSTGDITNGTGAAVGAITAGGPAATAGLKAGDVVTAVDGKPIEGSADLVAAIAAKAPGDQITLTVKRGGDTTDITATLGTQPAQRSTTGP
ncbi:MAG TPA: trypsin-like peptidase domain-containing protein [Miltoncostaea sp.]|nr:trypsin-like peptidase domain-containing protein [Miltoncostaea sp.]